MPHLPFLLLCILCACGLVGPLPLHLMGIFPRGPERGPLSKALRKAVSDADSGLFERDLTLQATSFFNTGSAQILLEGLCENLRGQRPPPTALLSFVGPPMSFYVALIGAQTRLPVIGLSNGYEDTQAMNVHPYYLPLDPNPSDLAHATSQFLAYNGWTRTIVIRDSSTFYASFTSSLRTPIGLHVKLENGLKDRQLFERVADVLHSDVRVIVVACGKAMAERVMKQARKANLLNGKWIWILVESALAPDRSRPASQQDEIQFPAGVLGIRLRTPVLDKSAVRSAVLFFASSVTRRLDLTPWTEDVDQLNYTLPVSCFFGPPEREEYAKLIYRTMLDHRNHNTTTPTKPVFDVYNLVHRSGPPFMHHVESNPGPHPLQWKRIGDVTGGRVSLEAVLWLGRNHVGPPQEGRRRYRVVTAYAPPFVMPATRVENQSCLLGLPCLQVKTNSKVELSRLFTDYHGSRELEGVGYNISCCAGISMDLMKSLAMDLNFDFDLYLVADGYFGTRRGKKWNGLTLDVQSGAAHMAFTAFSITRERSMILDFSVPFLHSGVSCLTFHKETVVPLSAFLVPFSVQLWLAIFLGLNLTAVFAAIYEWLSPFGLNPWGRMRTRNFSLASALWVMWSLLFSHLVAFKAPKSWPNKVLINLWGCFSVIFVSSYTANIAAHFAGLFFHLRVDDFHDISLLNQRTGTAKGSAAESYIYAQNPQLWQHIQRYGFVDLETGLEKLRRGNLDVLVGDTVVLDYYRGNDPGCNLHLLGQSIFDDAYAVGMQKGFRLKKSISKLILRYNEYGFMEQLEKKWFGRVPCFNHSVHRLNKPQPLSLRAVAGVFLMLLLGAVAGIFILFGEHAVFKHALPKLRKKPADCFWRSPNVMFFSQKLYRFINTVELVSPHHSAKEIVSNLKEGQIFSLFQKSVKRKAKEEARRRKSKSQFFEIIQEIRKVVKLQKELPRNPDAITPNDPRPLSQNIGSPLLIRSPHPADTQQLIFVPQSTSSPPKTRTSWTDLYRRGPAIFGTTKYSHLHQQYDEPPPMSSSRNNDNNAAMRSHQRHLVRNDSLLEDFSSGDVHQQVHQQAALFDTTVLSISVEDLRLAEDSEWRSFRRHKSLDDAILRKDRRPRRESPLRLPTTSEPKMARKMVLEVDDLVLYSMTKEDIIHSWQASERKLLNKLRDAVREKKALERKLAFIQKTLVKPP